MLASQLISCQGKWGFCWAFDFSSALDTIDMLFLSGKRKAAGV